MNQPVQNRTTASDRAEAVAELRRLRAEIAADHPTLTDEDWDALAERAASEVNEALRDHVRTSRGEIDSRRQTHKV